MFDLCVGSAPPITPPYLSAESAYRAIVTNRLHSSGILDILTLAVWVGEINMRLKLGVAALAANMIAIPAAIALDQRLPAYQAVTGISGQIKSVGSDTYWKAQFARPG